MKKIIILNMIISLCFSLSFMPSAMATEPNMADYTAYPIFMVQAVKPNIMIILDNSGSMNFNAYGSYPGNGGEITNALFAGEPYHQITRTVDKNISATQDDAEENSAPGDNVWSNSDDLNLGGFSDGSDDSVVGLRFRNIPIPKGAMIISAYIEFEAYENSTTIPASTSFTFVGENSDDAAQFENTVDNISSRPATAASMVWNSVPAWTVDTRYQTPELNTIVQEIINRDQWMEGNALAFRITGNGRRDAKSYDHTDGAPLLHIEFKLPEKKYYGYFNPDYFYYYDSNKFVHKYKKIAYTGDPTSGGSWSAQNLSGTSVTLTDTNIVSEDLWDGNWLNWVSMRRVDVLRKVLMGGLATSRSGGGNQVNYAETPAQSSRIFKRHFDSSIGSAVSPHDGDYWYGTGYGYIYVDNDSDPFTGYTVRNTLAIQKQVEYEPEDFHNYDSGDNLAGILQKIGDKARWGNIFFNTGTGNNQSGGTVQATIGTGMTSLITDIQNTGCDTWTPLAESFYVATQYFKQEDPASGLDYPNNAVPNDNVGDDPYYNNGFVWCAKSFVILLTDGASTKDQKIPDELKDYDGDGDNTACNESSGNNCDYPSSGTDFLDDVALYARTTDLRADLDGDQNIILYTVYAFGDDNNARSLLSDAAKNGGFIDRNGNNLPDLDDEWDRDGDNIPDTFYEASDGYELERKLLDAITDILKRTASGTAASVLATNSEGEGNMVQAYFRPTVTSGEEEAKWLGYVQSLWVDEYGNLREDTDQDHALDVTKDKVIQYFLDVATGDTKVKKFTVSATTPYPDTSDTNCLANGTCQEATLEEINPIFEAAKLLAARGADERKIFTYIDKDNDGVVDEVTYDSFDAGGEVIIFDAGTTPEIKPYLGVRDNTAWSYLGSTHDDRAANLIDYVRGKDAADLTGIVSTRNRTLNSKVWKLGDIVHSTPVSIAKPTENFHIIYKDESYQKYFDVVKNRETTIYVGANDGMLHAFTSWKYNSDTGEYTDPYPSDNASDSTYINGEQIGEELWAFVPQSLLPHLKWHADPDYTHTYYIDSTPKVFDAKILPDDTHYADIDNEDNWGTILLGGFNMGGKHIWSEDDYGSGLETRNFYPSYFCMDITDPRNPILLWERTYTNLSMSRSVPAIVRVGDTWFAVFGSGPTGYDGTSTQDGYIFVVDLKTGAPYQSGGDDWLFGPLEAKAFMNSPVALDKNLNYNVDGVYFGESYLSGSWKGKGYKVTIPCTTCDWDVSFPGTVVYDSNPSTWSVSTLFSSDRPITAPMSLSVDQFENAWVYFGTGRYISENDKSDSSQQYLYGIKDPFFNKDYDGGYYHNFSSTLTLDRNDLFKSDDIVVTTEKTVLENGALFGVNGTWDELLDAARAEDGWYKSLDTPSGPSERSVSKSAVLGGIVFSPTFTPNNDVCGFGGDSNFYVHYYETGTAYYKQILGIDNPSFVMVDGQLEEISEFKLQNLIFGAAPPSVGMHAGREKGAKAYLQQSTGQVVELDVDTAFNFKSGLTNWREN